MVLSLMIKTTEAMTAVQQLAGDLLNVDNQEVGSGVNSETLTIVIKHSKMIELLQKAKELERQQIINAFWEGHKETFIYDESTGELSTSSSGEYYYNQTYKP